MWVNWQWSHHSMTPPDSGSTAVFNGSHQTKLVPGQIMRLPVCGAVESKDVGQLWSWRCHAQCLAARAEGTGIPNVSSGLRTLAMALGETAA